MNTPTPRTDAALRYCKTRNESGREDMAGYSVLGIQKIIVESKNLERELTAAREELKAVTEQRDEMTLRWELTNDSLFDKRALADRLEEELKKTQKHLKDANRGAEINAHALRINADKLIAVTKQRDKLAEALNKMISICSCKTEDIDTVNEIRDFVDTITKHSNP